MVCCKDCKFSRYHYQRFNNNYVCAKNMDKWGRIPEEDLKGHDGYFTCKDGREKQMDAFITLDNIPDWQIGQEVTIYFPDTMQKRGVCKRYNRLQYNGVKYDRCNSCGSLINSVDNSVACGRCGSPVNWSA